MFVTKWMDDEEEGRERENNSKKHKKGLYFVQTEVTSIMYLLSCSVISVMAEGRVGMIRRQGGKNIKLFL